VLRASVVLAVLVLLLVGAVELLAPRLAEQAVATRVQEAAGLAAAPEVEIRGRPFLTQAVRGRYDDVVVRGVDVPAGQVRFDSVVTQLTGVRLPLRAALARSVTSVPVDRLSTRAVLGYDDLTAVVRDRGLRVTPAGDGLVRVTGSLEVLGRTLEASAVSRPTLEARALVVTAERFEVGNSLADALISRALGNRLDFRVELAPLPYGLELRSLQVQRGGVVLLAQATDAVLR
jgi:hypothetical protein